MTRPLGVVTSGHRRSTLRLVAYLVIVAAAFLVGVTVGRVSAARPETSEVLEPGLAGGGSSAASLVPGAPHDREAMHSGDGKHGAIASAAPDQGLSRPSAPPNANALVRTGWASWYSDGSPGFYAALPGLWRKGRWVSVCAFPEGRANCETAPVITSCLCRGDGNPKVIDLSPALWEAVAGMTAAERELYGVVWVRVEVLR